MKNTTLLISLLIFGCSVPLSYKVEHQSYESLTNPFTTDRVTIFREILFTIQLEEINRTDREEDVLVLSIVYTGSSWLFMGGDVVMSIDGEIIRKKDSNPNRDVVYGGSVAETIRIILTEEEVKRMAESKNLKFEFYGEPITITETGLSIIKQFYQEFIFADIKAPK